MPTIRSRCQRVPVPVPPARESFAWLIGNGLERADAKLALLFAANAPLAAQALANQEQLPQCRELTRRLQRLQGAPDQLYPTAQWLAEQGEQVIQWIKCYLYHGLKLTAAGKQAASASMPPLAVADWVTLVEQCHQVERDRLQSAGLNLALQLVPLLNSWIETRRG